MSLFCFLDNLNVFAYAKNDATASDVSQGNAFQHQVAKSPANRFTFFAKFLALRDRVPELDIWRPVDAALYPSRWDHTETYP
jgi:hypothetical protein